MSDSNDGYIPHLEQEVLGALLLSGNLKPVLGILLPEHFIEPIHQRLFDCMFQADASYSSINPAVLYRMFGADEQATMQTRLGIPISQYMANLAGGTVHGSGGLKRSVPAMLQQWARLSIGNEAAVALAASTDPNSVASDMIRSLSRKLDDVSASIRLGRRSQTRFTMGEASSTATAAIEEARTRGNGLTGVTWGLSDVDRATGGLQRGEMAILGARPSMGKTAVGLGIGINAAKSGIGVAFISLEMKAATLAMRALSDIAFDQFGRVEYSDLNGGRIDDTAMEHIYLAEAKLSTLPIQIEDASGLSILDIRTKFERMAEIAEQAGTPIGVLIVDYLQLIAPSGRYQGNRTNEVTEISAALRNMAREYNIALLALSQLSRQVESRDDKRPVLSDLRESGSLEQDADVVVFLYREAYYLSQRKGKDGDAEMDRLERLAEVQNKLEFIIAKQRMGVVKSIDLFVDIACSAVRNAVKD